MLLDGGIGVRWGWLQQQPELEPVLLVVTQVIDVRIRCPLKRDGEPLREGVGCGDVEVRGATGEGGGLRG